jgi:hypothetical protein
MKEHAGIDVNSQSLFLRKMREHRIGITLLYSSTLINNDNLSKMSSYDRNQF